MRQSLDLPGSPNRTRVVVAMSGGVDSSVVAGLLKRAGYDVVGMTLQLYDHGEATHRKGACCAGQDIHDARRVAETLGIPHYVLDYEERFRHAVIDRFAESYAAGETPVPCVTCNQTVKFADLLETARRLGADALATGHYVRSDAHGDGPRPLSPGRPRARPELLPLRHDAASSSTSSASRSAPMTKAETRAAAREFGLPVAEKHDSQDICFVPSGRYADVIRRLKPDAAEAGEIVHIDGRVLGRHDGIINFTVGQRRGIGVAAGEPLYVVHLDPAGRRVIVGPREALATRRLHLRAVNWLGDGEIADLPADGIDVFARVRSTRPPMPARLVRRRRPYPCRPRRRRGRGRARTGLRLLRWRRRRRARPRRRLHRALRA